MRKFLRNTVAALGMFLASLAAISPALALTAPPTFAPRMFQTQQTHYLRFSVNFNSCAFGTGLVCTAKVGNLPYNAFIVRGYTQIVATWNAGTSASIGLGTNSPATNLLASAANGAAAAGAAFTPLSIGQNLVGNGAVSTGQDGGFDIFATITVVGSLPTTGSTTYIIEYVAPNDGSCTNVPMASTPAGC